MAPLQPLSLEPSIALLRPIIALNIWTFIMEAWMYATRIPAVSKYNVPTSPQATLADFNARIPRHIQWKADNYNHLLEQPTQFYAVALTLALLGDASGASLALAWAYVGTRVVHSLVQAIANRIMVRFSLFVGSGALLLCLTLRAASVLFLA